MPPPESSAIDDAIIAQLMADATLEALTPDGVYLSEAPPGSTRFVIVSLVEAMDVAIFGGRAIESALYQVKAVVQATGGGVVQQAAARIDALLEDVPLTVPGYAWMTTHRVQRLEPTNEPDESDPRISWQHSGGRYRVEMSIA
jgi:hypothetical protein